MDAGIERACAASCIFQKMKVLAKAEGARLSAEMKELVTRAYGGALSGRFEFLQGVSGPSSAVQPAAWFCKRDAVSESDVQIAGLELPLGASAPARDQYFELLFTKAAYVAPSFHKAMKRLVERFMAKVETELGKKEEDLMTI